MTEDEFEEVREIAPVSRDDGAPPGFVPAVEALPGLARVAAAACWHSTEWGVRTTARAGRRVMRAVTDPVEAAALARDATEAASVIGGLARAVSSGVPLATALTSAGESLGELAEPPGHDGGADRHDEMTLRERGAELLERSRDVWNDDVAHPAYERILDELAPDEARILLLLLQGGPQPSVDVRTGGPVGMVHSQLVAPGTDDDRRPGRLPPPRPGPVVPQQPVPARAGLVLPGGAARPAWSTRWSRRSRTCWPRCTR